MKIEGGLTENQRSNTQSSNDRAQIIIPSMALSRTRTCKTPLNHPQGLLKKRVHEQRKKRTKRKRKNKNKRKTKEKKKRKQKTISHSKPTHSISSKAVKLSEGCPEHFSIELIISFHSFDSFIHLT